jgi:TolB-like protein/Tfp pilus assembly protein PilF
MIGTTLAHYRITGELGAGGMGEVWRAEDTKLGRDVALKILSEEFADNVERLERFEREARAVASLNHPHIVTIYSVEEMEGIHFLTMELIEGRSLDKLIPEGGLDLENFFNLATPLAEAISAAHDKSVIHRDLKPSNVMVDGEGRVKVLDFGLAKLQQAGDVSESTELPTEALTGVGMVVGTVPYMSPEQIEGKIVDHRTDVFSLGVLLYEMATGERPFSGESQPALMSSILKDVPQSVVDTRSDLPRHVGRVIGRCLEKDRRDRYQTARDVYNELKALRREASSSTSAARAFPAADRTPSGHKVRTSSDDIVSASTRSDEGFWIAVLPFKHSGNDADLTALSEGLGEDIITGLSRFSYLRVISRSSTLRYASEGADIRSVGEELGARYVMEGTLRQAGQKLRLSVHLVDVTTGTHLWAETYERAFNPEAVFELQDDLVPRIVSTVADMHGVLPRRMGEALRSLAPDQLSPYQAVLRSFAYLSRLTADELAAARSGLELAVQKAPTYTDAWAMLALLCAQEYGQDFNLLPDALAVGADAARRAVETGSSNHLAHFSLAQVLFFKKEFEAFRNAAERAAALNPMDGNSSAFLGELLTYAGDVERGLELAKRAKQLNPHHPGWYWMPDFYHAYSQGDYSAALAIALKMNLPGHIGMHMFTAAASGQLGKQETAAAALRHVLELRPDFAEYARSIFVKWWNPEHVEHLIDGLRKAGLEIPETQGSGVSSKGADESQVLLSAATRADEGFWVAVLPFRCRVGDQSVEALVEGLTEDIITGLSRFTYLRVISRSSTSRYADQAHDVRAVGEALGARYVMEGSVRQAGAALRVAVQLVDAESGANLWAETYNRPYSPETVFELQDDLAPRIVSTVADMNGILPHTMSEALRGRDPDGLTPYEALLLSFGYYERLTAEDHAVARAALEKAVLEAPDHADCWALLSMLYAEEHKHGFNMKSDPLGRALEAARRAVAAAPSNNLAHHMLAQALFFRRELKAFRNAADRAVELNPMDGCTTAFMGILMAYAGDWDHGCALAERAMELNPYHPGWYRFSICLNKYRKRDYGGALDVALKINMPTYFFTHATLAGIYGQLGEKEKAKKALRELLAQKPDFAETAREDWGKWFGRGELVEQLVEGLEKAGLDVSRGTAESGALTPARPKPAAEESGRVAIAVLPFTDMSPDKDQDYFCEGMAEEIMNALVHVDGIRVASRTSTFKAVEESADLQSIGRTLKVGQILEGGVRLAGNRLRVTAQLTDVESGYQAWSERYDREVEDVFAIQDEIAAGVVEAVTSRMASGERKVRGRDRVGNVEAYRHYLKGRHYRYSKNDHANALEEYEKAVALDTTHGPSLLGVAENKMMAATYNLMPIGKAIPEARRALETAAKSLGETAEGLYIEGIIAYCERDWPTATEVFRRAVELEPHNAKILCWCAITLMTTRRADEGMALLERAREVDPLSPFPYGMTALGWLLIADSEKAVEVGMQARVFDDQNTLALWAPAVAEVNLGHFDSAIEALQSAVELGRRSGMLLGLLGWALAATGRPGEARDILDELRARPEPAPTVVAEGWLLAALGRHDEAWKVLERAVQENQPFVAFTEYPGYDPLRSDPRFPALVERLGLPPSPGEHQT